MKMDPKNRVLLYAIELMYKVHSRKFDRSDRSAGTGRKPANILK